MKRLLLFSLLSLFTTVVVAVDDSSSSATAPSPSPTDGSDFIRESCNATLYPDVCYSSLQKFSPAVQQNPRRLATAAIAFSLTKVKHVASFVSNLTRSSDYGADPSAAAALHDCFSNFDDAVDEIYGSLKQMRQMESSSSSASKESFRFQVSNVQTWMSAALTNEDTCTDGFEDVNDGEMKEGVCDRALYVKKLTSNALALVNSFAQKELSTGI